jgi:hypothetical protein
LLAPGSGSPASRSVESSSIEKPTIGGVSCPAFAPVPTRHSKCTPSPPPGPVSPADAVLKDAERTTPKVHWWCLGEQD